MKLSLSDKVKKASDVIEFRFTPKKETQWIAGQFMQYYIDDTAQDDRGNDRYFTISSAPFEKDIFLTTRFVLDKGSSFKNKLYSMNIGDIIDSEGPFGNFILENPPENNHYIFIAGGIGITPFRSILIDLENKGKLQNMNISLLYSNRNDEFVYKDLLDELQLQVLYSTNSIDKGILEKKVKDFNNNIFYLSGPEGFVKYIKEILKNDLMVNNVNIKFDYFPGYDHI